MIIRDISLVAYDEDNVATLTVAIGKSAAMATNLPLNGPSTAAGGIDVQSADLADAMKELAAALIVLAPTL